MNNELEIRSFENSLETEDNLVISGYAIRFNQESQDLGGFREVITPEALRNIDLSDSYLLYNHNTDYVLGNTSSGTLSLTVDNNGLHFRAQLPDTTQGKDIYKLIQRGDLKGMSFAMKVQKDEWDLRSDPPIRKVKQITDLREVSVVPFPAYKQTTVSTRSLEVLEEAKQYKEECQKCKELAQEANKILNEIKQ